MSDEHENELWEAPFPNLADVAKRLSSFDRFLGTNDSKDLDDILREDNDDHSFASLEESSFNIGKGSHAHEASMARLARHSGILEQFYKAPDTVTLSQPSGVVQERSYQQGKVQSSKDNSQKKYESSRALIPKSPKKSGSSSTHGDRSKHGPDPNNTLDMATKDSHSEHSRPLNRTPGLPNKDFSQSPGAINKNRISRRDLYGVGHRSKQRTVTSNRSSHHSRESPRLPAAPSLENQSGPKSTSDHTSDKHRSRKEGSSNRHGKSSVGHQSRSSSPPPPVPLDDGRKSVSLSDVSDAKGVNRGERDAQLYGSVHRSKHRTPPSKLSSSHSDEGLRSLMRGTTSKPLANQSWHKSPSDQPSPKHRVRKESTRNIRPGIGADVQQSRSSPPRSPKRVGGEQRAVSMRNLSGTRGFSRAVSDPQSHLSRKARSVRTLSTHNESTRSERRSRSGNNLEDLREVSGDVLPSSFSRVPKKSKSPGRNGTDGSKRHALERPDLGLSLSRSRSGQDVVQQQNRHTRTEPAGSDVAPKQGRGITRIKTS